MSSVDVGERLLWTGAGLSALGMMASAAAGESVGFPAVALVVSVTAAIAVRVKGEIQPPDEQ